MPVSFDCLQARVVNTTKTGTAHSPLKTKVFIPEGLDVHKQGKTNMADLTYTQIE